MHAFVLRRCFNQNTGAGPQAGCDVPINRDAQFLLTAPLQGPRGGRAGAGGSGDPCPPQPYCGSRVDTFSFVSKTRAQGQVLTHRTSIGTGQAVGVYPVLWREIRDMEQLFKHR